MSVSPFMRAFFCLPCLMLSGPVLALTPGVTMEVEQSTVEAVPWNAPKEYDLRILDIDVYKLSPAARHLRQNHMITASVAVGRSRRGQRLSVGELRPYIDEASANSGLEAALIAAVISVESGFAIKAISEKGAQGLMQLMPGTSLDLGVSDPFDPGENIGAGSRYLAGLLREFDGSLELALAAYNAGPANVRRHGGVPPFKETKNFVLKVISQYNAYKAGAK